MKYLRVPIREADHKPLRDLWRQTFAMGHLVVLASMDHRSRFPTLDQNAQRDWTIALTQLGVPLLTLRAAWSVAAVGKPLLSAYKKSFKETNNGAYFYDSLFCLVAMGLRHKSLRSEVRKALQAERPGLSGPKGELAAVQRSLRGIIDRAFDEPEVCTAAHISYGRQILRKYLEQPGVKSAGPYVTAESIPEQIALCVSTHHFKDYRFDGDMIARMFEMLPWVAQASAEDLFLPGDFIEPMRRAWTPDLTMRLLRQYQAVNPTPTTVRVEPKPGRNDPCACGSGRKFKVCCAA